MSSKLIRPSLIIPLLISLLPMIIFSISVFGTVTLFDYYTIQSESAAISEHQHHCSQLVRSDDDTFVWDDTQQKWMLFREQSSQSLSVSSLIGRDKLCIWPEDSCAGKDDRIIDQLSLKTLPKNNRVIKIFPPHAMKPKLQTIVSGASSYVEDEQPAEEEEEELTDDCHLPEDDKSRCKITYDLDDADVVIFPNADVLREPERKRRADQIWIAYLLESPQNTFLPERYQRMWRSGGHKFNWTASYRRDSDIVTPYAKFVPYHPSCNLQSFNDRRHRAAFNDDKSSISNQKSDIKNPLHRELIQGKKKKVAWFASNCHTDNKRLEFARKLSKYIQVDIYGKCGSFNCDKWNQTACLEMLNKDYKFYLSFENSNSKDYITEKLFRNALGHQSGDFQNYLLLPIVMGPPRSNYELSIPADSFIHVDDDHLSSSSEELKIEKLANYLKLLDSNDALYYSHFRWKTMGRFVETKFMCRVCLLAHESFKSGRTKTYADLRKWFRQED